MIAIGFDQIGGAALVLMALVALRISVLKNRL